MHQVLIVFLIAFAGLARAEPSVDPTALARLVLTAPRNQSALEKQIDSLPFISPDKTLALLDWIYLNPRIWEERWAQERFMMLIFRSVRGQAKAFAMPEIKARFAKASSRLLKFFPPASLIEKAWLGLKAGGGFWDASDLPAVQRTLRLHGAGALGSLTELEASLSSLDLGALQRTLAFAKWLDASDAKLDARRRQFDLVQLTAGDFIRLSSEPKHIVDEQIEKLPKSPFKEICKVACNGLSTEEFSTVRAYLSAFNRQYIEGDLQTLEMLAFLEATVRDPNTPLAKFIAYLKSYSFSDPCAVAIAPPSYH